MFRISSLIAGASLLALTATSAFADKNDDTLRIGWGGDGVMINADNYLGGTRTGIWFTKMVWDTLIERDNATGEYKGSLATAWQWVDDKTLELKLREGVSFHNGAEFGADDVVFTYNTMSAENSGARFRAIVDWIDHVEKVDAMTVRIHTKEPFPQALEFLSGPMPIYPHKYYAQVGSVGMSNKPVGTGPYKVVEMKPGEQYTLVRNDDYDWGSPKSKAKITNVIIREIPDAQTQVAELMSGGIDVTADMSPDLVTRLAGVPGLEAKMSETLRIFIIGLDAAKRANNPAVNDVRVRQALNYAVDVKTMVETLLGGQTKPIVSIVNPPNNNPDLKPFEYDPEKAKGLLAEAGFTDFEIPIAYGRYPAAKEASETVAAYLEAIGLKPKIEAYEPGKFVEMIRAKAFKGIYYYGWASLINPSVELVILTSDAVDNSNGYNNPDYDALVKKASVTLDDGERQKLLTEAETMIWEDCPWIYLWYLPAIYGVSNRLDFPVRPDDYVEMYRAKLTG